VGGDDAGEPGQCGSAERCGGEERAEAGMSASACEEEGEDERVERGDGESGEKGERDDVARAEMMHEDQRSLGEDEQRGGEAVERLFAEAVERRGHEQPPDEFGGPEIECDGGGARSGVDADGVAGQPASESVFDADVEQHGDGEEDEQGRRQRDAGFRLVELRGGSWRFVRDGEGGQSGYEKDGCGEVEEGIDAGGTAGADEDGADDGADAPGNVEDGEQARAGSGGEGAGDDVACGESRAEAEADAEESNVRGVEVGDGDCRASCRGEDRSRDDAKAETMHGEVRADELARETGGEERSGLRVLNVPAVDERGKQRPEHDGGDPGDAEVEEDRREGAERMCAGGEPGFCRWEHVLNESIV